MGPNFGSHLDECWVYLVVLLGRGVGLVLGGPHLENKGDWMPTIGNFMRPICYIYLPFFLFISHPTMGGVPHVWCVGPTMVFGCHLTWLVGKYKYRVDPKLLGPIDVCGFPTPLCGYPQPRVHLVMHVFYPRQPLASIVRYVYFPPIRAALIFVLDPNHPNEWTLACYVQDGLGTTLVCVFEWPHCPSHGSTLMISCVNPYWKVILRVCSIQVTGLPS